MPTDAKISAPNPPPGLPHEPFEGSLPLDDGHHEEIADIVQRTPHWVVRSGSGVLCGVLALLMMLSCLLRFPDVVKGKAELVGDKPAAPVVAQTSGYLEMLASEGDHVESGAIVAVIQNSAEASAVLKLGQALDDLLRTGLVEPKGVDQTRKVAPVPPEFVPDLDVEAAGDLGEVQHTYSEFCYLFKRLKQLTTDDYPEKTLAALEEEQKHKVEIMAAIEAQRASLEKEIAMSRDAVTRNQALKLQGATSEARVEALRQDLMARERQAQSLAAEIKLGEIEANAIAKKVLDFNHDYQEQLFTTHAQVREALKQTISAIELWDRKYVLRAPATGHISFFEFWSSSQHVEMGREVFLVIPKSSRVIGRVKVQGKGVGKIRSGQRAILELADYPAEEFGVVPAQVTSISSVAREGHYIIILAIDDPLTTNFGRRLTFRNHMVAEGRIITEELSLMDRIFHSLRYFFTARA